MKYCALIFTCLFLLTNCNENIEKVPNIITSDIDNFWVAFDKISSTEDSILQLKYLHNLFLDKGSPGLYGMIQARNYTPEEYISAINDYPRFWNSIRQNTYKSKKLSSQLEVGINKLEKVYPQLKPARIYFTIGALRSNGTTIDSMVLIGSELAFGNTETVIDELPDNFSHLESFFETDPSKHIVFLNVHEYIHTQQKTTIGNTVLAQAVIEGVAEFVTEKALQVSSPNPQIDFGIKNDQRIKASFEPEMFSEHVYNWIWNSADNEFGMRDLAYYVGYAICENYFINTRDKKVAIRKMIELDYNNEKELIDFVNQSGYFSRDLEEIKNTYESMVPKVVGIKQFENDGDKVDPSLKQLTILFSERMDEGYRNFELGSLGVEHVIRFKNFVGFSENGKELTFDLEPLASDKRYQIVVGYGFRNIDGMRLKPYLIEFETGDSLGR